MSIAGESFDKGTRGYQKTLDTGYGIVSVGEVIQVDEMRGIGRQQWQGVLQRIGCSFVTVDGMSVQVCNVYPVAKQAP